MSDADILNIARNAINTGAGVPEAIVWIKKAIDLYPEDQVLNYLLGVLLLKKGDKDDGLRSISESMRPSLNALKPQDRLLATSQIAEYSRNRQLYSSVTGEFFSYLSFVCSENENDKRRAFKDSVSYIEFETSSMCNRACHYCPNSLVDRRSHNNLMNPAIFEKVVRELSEIDYDGIINMSGYNEPLADRSILDRVRTARQYLPKAYLRMHSNGDYLNREYLEELRDAGLNNIQMSIHRQPNEPFSNDANIDRIRKMGQRLDINDIKIITNDEGTSIHSIFGFAGLELVMFQIDYENYGLDRGGLMDGIGQQIVHRTAACTLPIYLFTVHYNGNVMPCCHFVGDNKNHEDYICGNVGESSIFDIYSGPKLVEWRKGLYSLEEKKAPCNTCTRDVGLPFNSNKAILG